MSLSLHSIAGSVGALLIVGSYLLLIAGMASGETLGFSAANAAGAALIIASLLVDFNLAAMLIEVFWLLISLYGMIKALSRKRSAFGS